MVERENKWEATRVELLARGCVEKRNKADTIYFEDVTGVIIAKACTKCSNFIELGGFSADKSRLGGRKSMCKVCDRKKGQKYREANPEKILESRHKCHEANPEKNRERARKWQVANPEKRKITNRKYRESNPEKVREHHRKYYIANSEKVREYSRKYREDNLEKRRELGRKWRGSNKEKTALFWQRYRARKEALPDTFTFEQQTNILSHFSGGCALTGSSEYHMDHVLPVATGHGGTTCANMVPLRSDLNQSKSDRHIFEWFDANKKRFNLSQCKFDELIKFLAQVNEMTPQEYRVYVDWCFDNPRKFDDIESIG